MGVNKEWKDQEKASEQLEHLKEQLFKSLKPYFAYSGKLDLSKKNPTWWNGDALARILNAMLVLTGQEEAVYFGADSVLAQQVIVETNTRMKFWGKIVWLSVPAGYESYKAGYDPFYGEFQLHKNDIQIIHIKFGDNANTNLDKVWWFDMDLDWIYEFEEQNG